MPLLIQYLIGVGSVYIWLAFVNKTYLIDIIIDKQGNASTQWATCFLLGHNIVSLLSNREQNDLLINSTKIVRIIQDRELNY